MEEEEEVEVVEEEEKPPGGKLSPHQDDPAPPIKVLPRRAGGPAGPAGLRQTLERDPRRTKRSPRGNRKLAEETAGARSLRVRGKSWEKLEAVLAPAWRNVLRNVRENSDPESLLLA